MKAWLSYSFSQKCCWSWEQAAGKQEAPHHSVTMSKSLPKPRSGREKRRNLLLPCAAADLYPHRSCFGDVKVTHCHSFWPGSLKKCIGYNHPSASTGKRKCMNVSKLSHVKYSLFRDFFIHRLAWSTKGSTHTSFPTSSLTTATANKRCTVLHWHLQRGTPF